MENIILSYINVCRATSSNGLQRAGRAGPGHAKMLGPRAYGPGLKWAAGFLETLNF